MIKILIAISLSLILFGGVNIEKEIKSNKVIYELIDDYKKFSTDSSDEIELTDDITVRVKLDVEEFDGKDFGVNHEDKESYREKAKQYYTSINEGYVENIEFFTYQDMYISKYSPYINYTFDRSTFNKYETYIINEINEKSYIETAYIKENFTINRDRFISGTVDNAGAWDQWNNNYYTGDGVIVGVLEPGLVDETLSIFDDISVTVLRQNTPNEAVHEHSTFMAGCIAGREGVAKDASILSACLYGVMDEEVDWMLDNNVDIINMSYGDANPTGIYDSDSCYADYIVNQYKITMVAAVGNSGEESGFCGNPSLGYNVVSLGAANDGVVPSDYSAYLEAEGCAPKPTLVLVGSAVSIPSMNVCASGTSVSSACASGLIALLMEAYPTLKTNPEKLQAILVSSARQHPSAVLLPNGFCEPLGAGMIHYENFQEHYLDAYTIMNVNGRTGVYIHTKTLELTAGTKMRFSIAWTAYTNGQVSSLKYTNYDLYLFDADGNIVATANSTNANIELITFTVPTTGTYKLKIKQLGTVKKINEKIGISYGEAAGYYIE